MWDYIKRCGKPVVLYGTGNAADRVVDECKKRNIEISGIFASDGFVRDREFRGFHVMSYAVAKEKFPGMLVLLCFGSHLPDVISNIRRIGSECEMLVPDFPVAGEGCFTPEYYEKNAERIKRIREILADDRSREVLDCVIKYKLSGKPEYLYACETDACRNLSLLNLSENETYVDLGAYTGDTISDFLDLTHGKYKKIIAFEPDARNFRKLSENTSDLDNITLVNAAAGKSSGKIYFSGNLGRGGSQSVSGREITADSVDRVLGGREATYIKFDIEGSECDAIDGAAETIKNFRPKMLVSAYHRNDDLWTIPEKILSLCFDYKVFLRKNPCIPAWDISYYFV